MINIFTNETGCSLIYNVMLNILPDAGSWGVTEGKLCTGPRGATCLV